MECLLHTNWMANNNRQKGAHLFPLVPAALASCNDLPAAWPSGAHTHSPPMCFVGPRQCAHPHHRMFTGGNRCRNRHNLCQVTSKTGYFILIFLLVYKFNVNSESSKDHSSQSAANVIAIITTSKTHHTGDLQATAATAPLLPLWKESYTTAAWQVISKNVNKSRALFFSSIAPQQQENAEAKQQTGKQPPDSTSEIW